VPSLIRAQLKSAPVPTSTGRTHAPLAQPIVQLVVVNDVPDELQVRTSLPTQDTDDGAHTLQAVPLQPKVHAVIVSALPVPLHT
jgi:hypothetical protein